MWEVSCWSVVDLTVAKPVDFPLCPTLGPSQFEMSASKPPAPVRRVGGYPSLGAVAPYFIGMQHAGERARYALGMAHAVLKANSLMGHGKGVGRTLAF